MALTYCPALQVVHDAQLAAFVPLEYVPALHELHARSPVELGVLPTYCPAWHTVHDVQLEALLAPEKAPDAHAEHV